MDFLIGLQPKINVSYLCNHSVVSGSSIHRLTGVDVSKINRHEGRTTFGYLDVAFRPTIA